MERSNFANLKNITLKEKEKYVYPKKKKRMLGNTLHSRQANFPGLNFVAGVDMLEFLPNTDEFWVLLYQKVMS